WTRDKVLDLRDLLWSFSINTSDATPEKAKRRNLNFYSPTTGTCQMSPFSSPVGHSAQKPQNPPAQGELSGIAKIILLSKYWEWDLTMTLMIVFQALEGSRELENLLGVSHSSCVLSAELQKTQELGEEKNPLLINKLFNKEPFITLNKDPSSCSLCPGFVFCSAKMHQKCIQQGHKSQANRGGKTWKSNTFSYGNGG
uniref:Uncharacterized protein n=1 Tax=Malurus cyaneus samueli TaxID=2593467 RepID=A0A8C5UJW9_9PASS